MEEKNSFAQDQRLFARVPVRIPATLINLDNKSEAEAIACDVSAQGVGVVNRELLVLGDKLALRLEMPDKKEPFYTLGEVAWTRLQGNGEYRTGIALERAEFMGMSRVFRA